MKYMKLPPKIDIKKIRLPAGTKIKFTKELFDGPDEFNPSNLYAEENSTGEVVSHNAWEGHMVKWDKWPAAFGAKYIEEFVIDYEYYEKNNININDWLDSNGMRS